MPDPLAEPATGGAAITPSDSADLAVISRGVYVGTSGDFFDNFTAIGVIGKPDNGSNYLTILKTP